VHYAAMVRDNMFWNGCHCYCGDLSCENICSVQSIQSVIDKAHSGVAKFINCYSTVKAAFNCIVIALGSGDTPKVLLAT